MATAKSLFLGAYCRVPTVPVIGIVAIFSQVVTAKTERSDPAPAAISEPSEVIASEPLLAAKE